MARFIGWCQISNGIQWFRVLFSFLVPLTTLIGNFVALFDFWPIRALLYISAFPPGHTPTSLDVICFVVYTYAAWLLIALIYLFYNYVVPILQWLWAVAILGLWGLFQSFYAADEQRTLAMERNSRVIARKIAYTTDVNPGYRYFGDPRYFKTDPYTAKFWKPNSPVSRLDPSGLPPQGRYFADVQRAANSNVTPFDRGAVPERWLSQHEKWNRDFGRGYYFPDDGGPEQLRQPDQLGDARQAFTSAEREQDRTTLPPPVAPSSSSRFYGRQESLARLGELRAALAEAAATFGRPKPRRSQDDLIGYERAHNAMLQSYCQTFYWRYQAERAAATARRKYLWERPATPSERRGFTPYSDDPLYDASISFDRMAASTERLREAARSLSSAVRRAPPPPARPSGALDV